MSADCRMGWLSGYSAAVQLAEDHMVAYPVAGDPLPSSPTAFSLSSLISSPHPVLVPRQQGLVFPRPTPHTRYFPPPSSSPSLSVPFSPQVRATNGTGAGVMPGPACWHCGDPGHFQDQCPIMEVGALVWLPDMPQTAPIELGRTAFECAGAYQAFVDSGCNQTAIHCNQNVSTLGSRGGIGECTFGEGEVCAWGRSRIPDGTHHY